METPSLGMLRIYFTTPNSLSSPLVRIKNPKQGLCTFDELQQSRISASHKQGQRRADVLFAYQLFGVMDQAALKVLARQYRPGWKGQKESLG
jgi:hypothetical protein